MYFAAEGWEKEPSEGTVDDVEVHTALPQQQWTGTREILAQTQCGLHTRQSHSLVNLLPKGEIRKEREREREKRKLAVELCPSILE
jgi:hypothetical protein